MITDQNDPLILRKQARRDYFGGIDRTTLEDWEKKGLVPPIIKLSQRVQGWRKSTLEQFLAERQKGTAA